MGILALVWHLGEAVWTWRVGHEWTADWGIENAAMQTTELSSANRGKKGEDKQTKRKEIRLTGPPVLGFHVHVRVVVQEHLGRLQVAQRHRQEQRRPAPGVERVQPLLRGFQLRRDRLVVVLPHCPVEGPLTSQQRALFHRQFKK